MKRGGHATSLVSLPRHVGGIAALLLFSCAASASGCARSSFQGRSFLPPVIRGMFVTTPAKAAESWRPPAPAPLPTPPGAGGPAAARYVERALRARGLRFGTDGSPRALYSYVRFSHQVLPSTAAARPGDLVFFDFARSGCGSHVGIVEAVDPEGRITFRESREGQIRRSHAHPGAPTLRRDERGRVLNTFLRPKRTNDPDSTRYFAGQLMCALGRVETRR